jgi:putative ABC transport system ATP-binding protein
MAGNVIIQVKGLWKIYSTGEVQVEALKGIDLTINNGDFLAIMGASGSGKSTFMNIIGCLDSPSRGEYYLDGHSINGFGKDELATIRNKKIGFVFQGFNLLARTTALENVELPLLYNTEYENNKNRTDTRQLAREALARVGLKDRLHHFSNQLSGGQEQRVTIARALVNKPSLILADEPTGNLDSTTSIEIMSIFKELNKQGITIVLVTHEESIACYAKRIIEFRDGRIIRDYACNKAQKSGRGKTGIKQRMAKNRGPL